MGIPADSAHHENALAAIAVEPEGEDTAAPNLEMARSDPRRGSKQGRIIDLLRRAEGATVDDLIAATGWLPHTTRAALTGLRKKGYGIAKSRREEDEKTVYRIERLPVAVGDELGASASQGAGS